MNIIDVMLISCWVFFEVVSLGFTVIIAVDLVRILILELDVSMCANVLRKNVIFLLDVQVSGFI